MKMFCNLDCEDLLVETEHSKVLHVFPEGDDTYETILIDVVDEKGNHTYKSLSYLGRWIEETSPDVPEIMEAFLEDKRTYEVGKE